ncbi:MAG: OmpA family protein [Myxococcales bacterium]|nr:OmpA family protein [Myxococcales bacterium]MCB9549877.1 OmpA family protein [Myxococcales bacterium]
MKRLIPLGLLLFGLAHAQDAGVAPPAGEGPDKAIVLTDSGLSITGLKQRYAAEEAIELVVAVPRQNVLRARTEVALMRDDTAGRPIYQDIRDYDRFTHVEALNFSIRLPGAERTGQLALLVRVRGLRNRGEGTPAEAFEDALTYRIAFESPAGESVVDQGTRLEGRVYFGFNDATLDEKSLGQVGAWAEALKAEAALSELRVEGHADKVGGSGYNLELSRRRAEAVRAALIERGVRPGIIRVVGFGFDRPSVKDAAPDPEDRGVWQNRRAEVVWFRERP